MNKLNGRNDMNNLIIYGTKYGTTATCANELASLLAGQTDVRNIEQQGTLDLAQYDRIIIGSSVYMGQINKGIKKFAEEHLARLLGVETSIFICSGLPENFDDVLKANFPEKLLFSATMKAHFGGTLDIDKMKFMDKTIAKMMSKQKGDGAPKVEIDHQAIESLASHLNGAVAGV